MSYFRGGKNKGLIYHNLTQPVEIVSNFVVDATNGNGLGIRSLKSNGWIKNVFMHTSAALTGTVATTAAQITSISGGTASLVVGMPVQGTGIPAGTVITSILSSSAVGISQTPTGNHASESITYQGFNNGSANPNPPSGYAWIQFKQNYNIYLGGFSGFVSQLSGSNVNIDASDAALTAGAAYVITSLGTSTLADWQAVGLPPGLVPTVGQSFIALVTGAGTGTGKVQIPVASGSGISVVDVIGDPNQSISNSSIAANGGAWVLVRFLAATSSGVTTLIATAPQNNAAVGMTFKFDQSSADPIMVNGDPASV